MDAIMYQKSYSEYKAELDRELQSSAESFVKIGYLLKVARDTNILAESGYKTVAEFAEAEYSLNKTQVSRFMSINDKFAENGYSERLADKFQGFGYAKLTIMLQIPEEIAQELSPEYTKAEIQAVKDEIDEEKKVSDIEVMMEGSRPELDEMTILEKVVHQLGETEPEIFKQIYEIGEHGHISEETIKEAMAPTGEKVYSVRIQGMGRVMLFLKASADRISIAPVRTPEEKQYFDWQALAECWWLMFDVQCESAEKAWEYIYEKDFPRKDKIAPVQQPAKAAQKPVPKKESKVSKAKTPKKPEKTKTEPVPVPDEQLPGQMEVADYPELMPESHFEEVTSNVSSDAAEGEEHGAGDFDGVPSGAGADDDALESEYDTGMEGSEVQSDDEGAGASESGGCETDLADLEVIWKRIYEKTCRQKEEMILLSVNIHEKYDKDEIKKLYNRAVDMAADLEKLLLTMEG